jgi:predicted MFS family arabinose efflux permease
LQGANDAVVNVASAAGSLGSGLLLAVVGFTWLAVVGFAVALLPLLIVTLASPSARGRAATSGAE